MYVIAALVVVVLNRKTLFAREAPVTEVPMPGEEGSPDDARITANT